MAATTTAAWEVSGAELLGGLAEMGGGGSGGGGGGDDDAAPACVCKCAWECCAEDLCWFLSVSAAVAGASGTGAGAATTMWRQSMKRADMDRSHSIVHLRQLA